MKPIRLGALILTLGWLFMSGCGGGGGDGSGNPFSPPPSDQLLTTATIGSGGGTMAADELTITVPAGCFGASSELKIYRSGDDQPFGSAAISEFYKLVGLPATFSQPVQVSFPVTGKSQSTLVALGETSFANSANGMVTGYRILESTSTDSTIVAIIPAAPDAAEDGGQGVSVHLVQLTGYSAKSPSSRQGIATTTTTHFQIYHIGQDIDAANLGTYLEAAYDQLKTWGFSYSGRTNWPVQVVINDMKEERFGEFSPSLWGNNYGSINFNALKLDQAEEMKVTAGHEFFHLVQALYDNRNRVSKSKSASDRYWLDEACSVWSERSWMGDPDYLSLGVRNGHQRLPFHYFHVPASGVHPDYHGYGMSAFIQYVVNRAGGTALGAIYDYILAHGNDPVAAIEATLSSRLGETFMEWHPDFLQKLIQGELYSDVNVSIAVAYDTATWEIDEATDTHQSYTYEYGPGSARFYILKLNYQGFTPTTILSLEQSFAGPLVVYKVHHATITKLGIGDSLEVEHLDDMVAAGDYLMVMATNSLLGPHYDYDTSMTLDLTIKESSGFKTGAIWVSGKSTMTVHETRGSSVDTTYTIENRVTQFDGSLYFSPISGSTEGATFSAVYDSMIVDSNEHQSGTMTITVDDVDNPTQVDAFSLNSVVTRPYSGTPDNTKTYDISGSAIPLQHDTGGMYYVFHVEGSGTEHFIDDVHYREVNIFGGTKDYTLTDFTAENITIKLNR